jgi:hypothetical protein
MYQFVPKKIQSTITEHGDPIPLESSILALHKRTPIDVCETNIDDGKNYRVFFLP